MDIKESLSKIVFLEVEQDLSHLSEAEKKALEHCVNAAKVITDLYLTQVYPKNLALHEELKQRTDQEGKDLLQYFELNGGPWDHFDEFKSFIPGIGAHSKGLSFYPADITEQEWERWLAENPEKRADLESNYTIIKRIDSKLVAVPYSEVYKPLLENVAEELSLAAALLPEGNLKKFLVLRAEAFLSNNYWDSDITWIDTDGHPFEVTIGPYEVYADELFGIKATFEAFVAIPDREATKKLQKFSAVIPEFDALLAQKLGHKATGGVTPLEVVQDVYRGGEAGVGRQFIAYNLPNNRKIHELKGSKKVFSRTMMEAKFSKIGQPIAEQILGTEDLKKYQFGGRLLFVLGHELAHGIGPGTRTVDGREVSFEVLLKDLHSMIEEAKADTLGAALLDHFYKKGLISAEEMASCIITEIVSFIQGWRLSYAEAHSAGSLIKYNWLKNADAISYDEEKKVFNIDTQKSIQAMIGLSEEFLKIQTEGSYEKATAFAKQWGFISGEIPAIVARLKDLPVEVHPIYKM